MLTKLSKDIYYSFPIQLFILHFKKFQVLLIFWFILFSTIDSVFFKMFGADALFFIPEYRGVVNFMGAFITGAALGFYVISWNITTFILHSKRVRFLATSTNPFLKYCINNALLPLFFLIFYFIKLYQYDSYRELMSSIDIIKLMLGILVGFTTVISISVIYFFGADKTILRTANPIESNQDKEAIEGDLKISYYFTGGLKLKKARTTTHYRQAFLDMVFTRHHLSAIISMVMAFIFLVVVGFFLENKFFEMPAASSVLIFFSVMVAVIGALTYFLQAWSIPIVMLALFAMNILYQNEIIDPRNKAYGLNYIDKTHRPAYNKTSLELMCTDDKLQADKANMIRVLNKWKARQKNEKPVMVFINVSGGGLRSAAFVMNALQKLDSATKGAVMNQTFLISGASGGMLAATYYRELYRSALTNKEIDINNPIYTKNIACDLLNPVFTSMITRDVVAPIQKFNVEDLKFVKDRGYAFEKKLSDNTNGLLNIQLKDVLEDETNARIPLIIYNSVVKSDGRKLMIGTQPMSFMMKPTALAADSSLIPDAIDFATFFKDLGPYNLRILTALRMNATFPYVLPNVWLPTTPVIDVMDAGLRDNYGQETTLRFIDYFKEWIQQNTGGVLIIQLRDRSNENWQQAFESQSIADMVITPATMLQHNWFKLQDYFQTDQYSYYKKMDSTIDRISLMYQPEKADKGAAMNFHLSTREKIDVIESFNSPINQKALQQIKNLLNAKAVKD